MKNIYSLLAITLFTVLISCNNSNSIQSQLMTMASDFNKNLPMVVDSYTTLSGTTVVGENEFMYVYKVKLGFFDDYNISQSEWLSNQTENTTNVYCTNEDMKWFKDNNVTVTWSYDFSDGTYIDQVSVSPNDCN
tara:strand:+ start:116 stop:517 length:402 start_codon:yes stop_codon:yes gene_type:complete